MNTVVPSFAVLVALSIGALPLSTVFAQERTVLPPGVKDLPIGFGPGERGLLGPHSSHVTAPPVGPARASAEWDENIGVFCLWTNAELLYELQTDNDLYVITTNQAWWDSWLPSQGVPLANVHYLNAPTDTWWVRDYGPWFMWDGNGDFGICDIEYNRPRPLDDAIPQEVGQAYGIPVYGADVIHTGGNYYADGYGNAWSTTLPYKENPTKTAAEVDQIMLDYVGIERYVTRNIPYDIEHIDTFGKILAPDSLIWGSFPYGTTPWTWCEAALEHYESLQSAYGWPYKVERMTLWTAGTSWTAYINSLQTSGKIIIPRYDQASDALATQVYQKAAPGYEIVSVDDKGTYWGDSVHCRARNFIRGDAIRIYARPHWPKCDDDLYPHEVRAEIVPDNSTSLAGSPVIRWSTTGGPPYSTEFMVPTGNPDEFSGQIPAVPHGSVISYFIEASDAAGNTKLCPLVAPRGMFTIAVGDDTTPPAVEHTAIHGLLPAEWPAEVACTARDDMGIPSVVLEYAIGGVPQPAVAMVKEEGTFRYTGTMTGAVSLGDLVSYRLVATDGASPTNVTTCPTLGGWNVFPIDDVKSVLVLELDGTPDSGEAWTSACDELGLQVDSATQWPASLSGYDALVLCLGSNPAKATLSSAQASALVAFLSAGGSAYLEGGDAFAQSSSSSIYAAWFGVSSASAGADLSPPVVGLSGTIAAGMSFGYLAPGKSTDHLTPSPLATLLMTANGGQGKLLAYSTGTYAAVASSIELGLLAGGASPSHVKLLAARCLDLLGMDVDLAVHRGPSDPLAYTVSLAGDPLASAWVSASLGPGWLPLGPLGVVKIDVASLLPLFAGTLPASGELALPLSIPPGPSLVGLEVYFQALVEDASAGQYRLTNRDRLTISTD